MCSGKHCKKLVSNITGPSHVLPSGHLTLQSDPLVSTASGSISNLSVFFSGYEMEMRMIETNCFDCNIYVGSISQFVHSSKHTKFNKHYPNINIDKVFDPFYHGHASQFSFLSSPNSINDNLNIYCNGSVSYCAVSVLKNANVDTNSNTMGKFDNFDSNNYQNAYMMCRIDSLNGKNYSLDVTDKNMAIQRWSSVSGCHWDCSAGKSRCKVACSL